MASPNNTRPSRGTTSDDLAGGQRFEGNECVVNAPSGSISSAELASLFAQPLEVSVAAAAALVGQPALMEPYPQVTNEQQPQQQQGVYPNILLGGEFGAPDSGIPNNSSFVDDWNHPASTTGAAAAPITQGQNSGGDGDASSLLRAPSAEATLDFNSSVVNHPSPTTLAAFTSSDLSSPNNSNNPLVTATDASSTAENYSNSNTVGGSSRAVGLPTQYHLPNNPTTSNSVAKSSGAMAQLQLQQQMPPTSLLPFGTDQFLASQIQQQPQHLSQQPQSNHMANSSGDAGDTGADETQQQQQRPLQQQRHLIDYVSNQNQMLLQQLLLLQAQSSQQAQAMMQQQLAAEQNQQNPPYSAALATATLLQQQQNPSAVTGPNYTGFSAEVATTVASHQVSTLQSGGVGREGRATMMSGESARSSSASSMVAQQRRRSSSAAFSSTSHHQGGDVDFQFYSGKSKPKRPLSAYNLFFKDERVKLLQELEEQQPQQQQQQQQQKPRRRPKQKVSFEEMGREIGKRWKQIEPQQKAHFQQRAAADKKRYEQQLQVYNGRKREELEAKLLLQEATVTNTARKRYLESEGEDQNKKKKKAKKVGSDSNPKK